MNQKNAGNVHENPAKQEQADKDIDEQDGVESPSATQSRSDTELSQAEHKAHSDDPTLRQKIFSDLLKRKRYFLEDDEGSN